MDNEEKMLADKLSSSRHAVEIAEKEARAAKHHLDNLKAEHETIKQACLDYMQGNGIVECDAFSLRKSYSVDIEDENAVPEAYQRVKTTITPNKQKIRDERPAGNWYVMKETINIVEK